MLGDDWKHYCHAYFTGSSIFVAFFTLYLAVDVVKAIGNGIRVRLVVQSMLIALRSFLLFAYLNDTLNQIADNLEFKFLIRTVSAGHLCAAMICSVIMVFAAMRYTIHPLVPRILACLLMISIGVTLALYLVGGFASVVTQISLYYAVAAALVAYDLQYL